MSTLPEVILLVGRVAFGAMFVYSAIGQVREREQRIAYARRTRMPLPSLAGAPTGMLLTAGALSVAAGVWPDVGSLVLGLFVLPAAYYFHGFWAIDDPATRRVQALSFWRNITLFGACMALFAFFATAGDSLDLVLTGSLLDLR